MCRITRARKGADHPRVGGDDSGSAYEMRSIAGPPPRRRGRQDLVDSGGGLAGTTPA